MSLDTLCSALAEILADYQPGPPMSAARVLAWVRQFREEEQEAILLELAHVYRTVYFPRNRVRACVEGWMERLLGGHDPEAALGRIRFLDVQRRGASQSALLRLADDWLRARWGRGVESCGRGSPPLTYVYLDDAVNTGNRIRYDLAGIAHGASRGWLRRSAAPGSRLLIYVLCCHLAGWRYAGRAIADAAGGAGVEWGLLSELDLNNERVQGSDAECLWPEAPGENLVAFPHSGDFGFRPPGTPPHERFFRSPETRSILEQAFLREGIQLLGESSGDAPRSERRPLGFEVLSTPGFGTLFSTYRNIPNNAPLVLWAGRGGARPWIPLLPRRSG